MGSKLAVVAGHELLLSVLSEAFGADSVSAFPRPVARGDRVDRAEVETPMSVALGVLDLTHHLHTLEDGVDFCGARHYDAPFLVKA